MFLSANEKRWLLLTTPGRFFQKDLTINHSTCLFFVCYLEESLKVWNWKVLKGIGRFHCNYKSNYYLRNSSISFSNALRLCFKLLLPCPQIENNSWEWSYGKHDEQEFTGLNIAWAGTILDGIFWIAIIRVGIFQVGVILGGSFPGGSCPGWELSG